MNKANPIDLLFEGMEKLGPGSNADTLKVLSMLPEAPRRVIADAGCGAGRQTLALANQLQTLIHAVGSHKPFLTSFAQRAKGTSRLKRLKRSESSVVPKIPADTFSI
ncbi:MAG: hypothetical protein PHW60_02925 [Kiritimatiellae bacterium]|nr:hypothetical protein [Kiritimatiellia bacterium]